MTVYWDKKFKRLKQSIKKVKGYLTQSKRRTRFLLVVFTVAVSSSIIIFLYYSHAAKRTKKFFKSQFKEKIESNITMATSWFINYTNYISYDINNRLSNLPPGSKVDFFLSKKAINICNKYQEVIKEVFFMNTSARRCEFIFPESKKGQYKYLYKIIDYQGLNIKNPLSKNFIYVYIPRTSSETVDSVLWGIISQTVKIRGTTVGKIYFIIDVSKIIRKKLPQSSVERNFYKISFVPLNKKFAREEISPNNSVKWDNGYLKLQFQYDQLSGATWMTRYQIVRKYLLYFSILAGVISIFALVGVAGLFIRSGIQQEKEIDLMYRQSKILNLITDNLKEKLQHSDAEEMVVSGLKILMEHKNVLVNVRRNDELIFITNGGARSWKNCPTSYRKGISQFCKNLQIGRDKFKIHLEFNRPISERDFIFHNILLEVIGFAANFSNEYKVRRSIESNTFKSILKLLGAKDHYTCDHSVSVSAIAEFIAREIGIEKFGLTQYKIEVIKMAGYLHDIGKMGIPDEILNKLGRYIESEMDIMKLHTKFTEMIIKPLAEYVDFYKDVLNVAVHHHERLDGSGYPYGLKGEEFTIEMQILAISDILDAMMRDRPYKSAKTDKEVIEDLKSMVSGPKEQWKFSPLLVEAVIARFHEIKKIPDKIDKDFCEIDIE